MTDRCANPLRPGPRAQEPRCLFHGCISGIASEIIGQPLSTRATRPTRFAVHSVPHQWFASSSACCESCCVISTFSASAACTGPTFHCHTEARASLSECRSCNIPPWFVPSNVLELQLAAALSAQRMVASTNSARTQYPCEYHRTLSLPSQALRTSYTTFSPADPGHVQWGRRSSSPRSSCPKSPPSGSAAATASCPTHWGASAPPRRRRRRSCCGCRAATAIARRSPSTGGPPGRRTRTSPCAAACRVRAARVTAPQAQSRVNLSTFPRDRAEVTHASSSEQHNRRLICGPA